MNGSFDQFVGQATSIYKLSHLVEDWLVAAGILFARPLALLTISPAFARAEFSGFMRGVVAMALVLPLWMPFVGQLQAAPPSILVLLTLAAKEALVGFMLGFPLALPFWTLVVAGDIIDQQRGATQMRIHDPAVQDEVSVTGSAMLMGGIIVFVMYGGLESVAEALYSSWAVWKPLAMLPMPDARTPALILGLLDTILRRGLELAMPVVSIMLLSDTAMLIVVRMAPRVRVDDIMSAARNLVFVIFLPLYAAYLLYYTQQDQSAIPNVLTLIEPVLNPHLGVVPPASQ